MLDKIKSLSQIQQHPLFQQFRDIRVIGFMVFAVIVLLVSYSGVSVIQSNFVLEKQVAKLEQENQVAQLQNDNSKLTNEYYKSDAYLELQARKQNNKGLPGETLVLIPKSVAMQHSVATTTTDSVNTASKKPSTKPLYQRNFEAWRDFFSHRSQADI